MELDINRWKKIKKYFFDKGTNKVSYSIATSDENGVPHICPIGSLILEDGCKGFYFDKFFSITNENLKNNNNICVMAINTSEWLFLKSLLRGKISRPLAVRLYGKVSEQRKASDSEINTFLKAIKPLNLTKGGKILWNDFKYVRDVEFETYAPINMGNMAKELDF